MRDDERSLSAVLACWLAAHRIDAAPTQQVHEQAPCEFSERQQLSERAFRGHALRHHPDLGGDTAVFAEMTAAIAEARAELGA